jgi:hypothetical protein
MLDGKAGGGTVSQLRNDISSVKYAKRERGVKLLPMGKARL